MFTRLNYFQGHSHLLWSGSRLQYQQSTQKIAIKNATAHVSSQQQSLWLPRLRHSSSQIAHFFSFQSSDLPPHIYFVVHKIAVHTSQNLLAFQVEKPNFTLKNCYLGRCSR